MMNQAEKEKAGWAGRQILKRVGFVVSWNMDLGCSNPPLNVLQ